MEGKIEFKEIDLRYRPNCELVLKKLSFEIPKGSKVGIVGRTGAGKSTICLTLSRIIEPENGCIEIDSIDISKVDLATLRKKVTVIPQDPTIFTGSLKYNLDPHGVHSDEALVDLIKEVGLEDILNRAPVPIKNKRGVV